MAEVAIAFLQAGPNIFETVRPDAVFVPVFPLMAARGDRRMILADQHRLDARRAKLNAQNGLSTFNAFWISYRSMLISHLTIDKTMDDGPSTMTHGLSSAVDRRSYPGYQTLRGSSAART
jgi:hypothetical protein